jgi:hypothetical protein
MPDPFQYARLSPEVRDRYDQIVADFVEAWRNCLRNSAEVSLEAFLPPRGDSLRLPVLHALIPLDLEQRRKRGESMLLEKYVARFPELGTASEVPVELIWAEYRIRSQLGDPLRLETYRSRFPRQFESLSALVSGAAGNSTGRPASETGR